MTDLTKKKYKLMLNKMIDKSSYRFLKLYHLTVPVYTHVCITFLCSTFKGMGDHRSDSSAIYLKIFDTIQNKSAMLSFLTEHLVFSHLPHRCNITFLRLFSKHFHVHCSD